MVIEITSVRASGAAVTPTKTLPPEDQPQAQPSAYSGDMPRPRRQVPSARVQDWPNTPSPDADVEVARTFANNLNAAIGTSSIREVSRATGVDHATISRILHGTTWPDLQTIARLEAGLAANLWPHGTATLNA